MRIKDLEKSVFIFFALYEKFELEIFVFSSRQNPRNLYGDPEIQI